MPRSARNCPQVKDDINPAQPSGNSTGSGSSSFMYSGGDGGKPATHTISDGVSPLRRLSGNIVILHHFKT